MCWRQTLLNGVVDVKTPMRLVLKTYTDYAVACRIVCTDLPTTSLAIQGVIFIHYQLPMLLHNREPTRINLLLIVQIDATVVVLNILNELLGCLSIPVPHPLQHAGLVILPSSALQEPTALFISDYVLS